MYNGFKKIEQSPVWQKANIKTNNHVKYNEPIARISKGTETLVFNLPAIEVIKRGELNNEFVDVFQSGYKFALAQGTDVRINVAKDERSAQIHNTQTCKLMYETARCRIWRVSLDGSYLVLTPAYDLNRRENISET